jgi:hypothetical protein
LMIYDGYDAQTKSDEWVRTHVLMYSYATVAIEALKALGWKPPESKSREAA